MYKLKIPWNNLLKLGKALLLVVALLMVGYFGYFMYFYATNTPYEVRVTNVTGTSATISWYTQKADKGIIVYKEMNSFFPVLSTLGGKLAYDDRDVEVARQENADDITKNAEGTLGVDGVTVDESKFNEVSVKKQGKYYVHHVTLENLSESTKYYFRVGNGILFWDIKSSDQKALDFEAPTVSEFSFSTYTTPEEIKIPDSAYGRVFSIVKNKDGFVVSNPSTDSIVFLKGIKANGSYSTQYMSSLTNSEGGWIIDKSALRNDKGELVNDLVKGTDKVSIYAQFENLEPKEERTLFYGIEDNPDEGIIGNDSDNLRLQGSIIDLLKYKLNKQPIETISYKFQNILSFNSYAADDCPEGYTWNERFEECRPKNTTCPNGYTYSTYDGQCHRLATTSENVPGAQTEEPVSTDPKAEYIKCNVNGKIIYTATQAECNKAKDDPKNTNESLEFIKNSKKCSSSYKDSLGNTISSPSIWSDELQACIQFNKAKEYIGCEGNYAQSCEPNGLPGSTTNCFCKNPAGNYLPLRGRTDCRPVGCANVSRGDTVCDSTGSCTSRTKCPADKPNCKENEKVLCGPSDYATPGCATGQDNCPIGTVYNAANQSCTDGSIPVQGTEKVIYCIVNGELVVANTAKDCDGETVTVNPGESVLIQCEYPNDEKPGKTRISYMTIEECSKKDGKKISGSDIKIEASNTEDVAEAPDIETNCKNSNTVFDCGLITKNAYDSQGVYRPMEEKCGSNQGGCGSNQVCVTGIVKVSGSTGYSKAGICTDKGQTVGYYSVVRNENNYTSNTAIKDSTYGEIGYDCWVKIENKKIQKVAIQNLAQSNKGTVKPESTGDWRQVSMDYCNSISATSLRIINNPDRVFASDNIDIKTKGAFIYFPESGLYDVQIGEYTFSNIKVNKDNNYFFYVERNSKDGYQQPEDSKNPKENEDLILNASGAVVTIATQSTNFKINISKGINLISFNFLPSLESKKALSAKEFLNYVNSAKRNVNRITSFESGKWNGGIEYSSAVSNNIVGRDFDLLPGKAYAIVAQRDATIEVPGFAIKNSIPVSLSSGWNLIGVNGYQRTYTANSLIDSINGIAGLTSNNVTWWPTSKGRYESFQKSEGVQYGFDFPILKNLGYFVRINDFSPVSKSTKSIIWNPESDLHGQPGSK